MNRAGALEGASAFLALGVFLRPVSFAWCLCRGSSRLGSFYARTEWKGVFSEARRGRRALFTLLSPPTLSTSPPYKALGRTRSTVPSPQATVPLGPQPPASAGSASRLHQRIRQMAGRSATDSVALMLLSPRSRRHRYRSLLGIGDALP